MNRGGGLAKHTRLAGTAALWALIASCSKQPAADGTATHGKWTQTGATGGEIHYLNTEYLSDGPPIVAELVDVWRPEPAFTYVIRDKRAFWCAEQDVALIERSVSKNGRPFVKTDLPADLRRRKSVREFDANTGSSTIGSPPNMIEGLLNKVCNRYFGERIEDPLAHFNAMDEKRRR